MAPTYSTENGVVQLEKKKDIVKRLGRSPDYADAVVYGNWVRPRVPVPEPRVEREGQSLGYDYERQRPREQLTGEQELARMFQRAQANPLANRNRVPPRRSPTASSADTARPWTDVWPSVLG
jgi:hypothetical protein